MAVCILLAKKDFKGDPVNIPPEATLEEWLAANFDIIGPLSDDQAEEISETVREPNNDRYWAILPMINARSAEDLI